MRRWRDQYKHRGRGSAAVLLGDDSSPTVEQLADSRHLDMETQLELCPGTYIGPGHPVFVVAEIGQNHQVSCDWSLL